MIVSSKPYPSLKILSNMFIKDEIPCAKKLDFFPLGRIALLSGMISLGLIKGDKIILPAYLCDSAIKPLRDFGYKLIFVDIDEYLNIPLSAIKVVINEHDIKAIIIVNYFGFKAKISPIIKFCESLNIMVIEDCSHSFLSHFLLSNSEIKSDMELYSMRKTLPIKDGGALRIKSSLRAKNIKYGTKKYDTKLGTLIYLLFRTIEKILVLCRFNIYSNVVTNIKNIISTKEFSIKNVDLDPGIPSYELKSYLYNQKYLLALSQKIRDNFTILSKETQKLDFGLPFSRLNDSSVPQVFVIYDNSNGFIEYLRNNGIGASKWPSDDIPDEVLKSPSLYENALKMNNKLVLFPIHQGIGKKHIDYMIKIIKQWDKNYLKAN